MHQIETGTMSPTQQDCVFLWLWCRDGKGYAKYSVDPTQPTMPMVFAVLRWDGMFGTIGGKVDAGESLRQALAREAAEEANYWLAESAEPVQLGTFIDEDWYVHSFALEITFAEMVEVRSQASAAQHASPECAGYCIVPTQAYQPCSAGPRGIEAFSLNSFCSTAKLEFDVLLSRINQD